MTSNMLEDDDDNIYRISYSPSFWTLYHQHHKAEINSFSLDDYLNIELYCALHNEISTDIWMRFFERHANTSMVEDCGEHGDFCCLRQKAIQRKILCLYYCLTLYPNIGFTVDDVKRKYGDLKLKEDGSLFYDFSYEHQYRKPRTVIVGDKFVVY